MGFIAFEKVEESERAIRGLNDMGFEASYARVSIEGNGRKEALIWDLDGNRIRSVLNCRSWPMSLLRTSTSLT
jgi:hypothetical protein